MKLFTIQNFGREPAVPKEQYDSVVRDYAALSQMFKALREMIWQPAPCDGPWQTRFAALDTEHEKVTKLYNAAVFENAELKIQVGALLKLLEASKWVK